MKTKDEIILEIRGASIGTISEFSTVEEKFQNQTLRPILKFQNEIKIWSLMAGLTLCFEKIISLVSPLFSKKLSCFK